MLNYLKSEKENVLHVVLQDKKGKNCVCLCLCVCVCVIDEVSLSMLPLIQFAHPRR